MFQLVENILHGHNKIMESGDPRVLNYPLMGSPLPTLTIFLLYIYFVFDYGPNMMKNREPYDLKKTIMGYNIVQILCNSWAIYLGFSYISTVSFYCTPLDTPYIPFLHYLYFLLKLLDLLDTVFFVLRKKYNQITFLHLYHHIVMFIGVWVTCKYIPGGQAYFLGFANTIVHVIMYFYYFLTSWESVQRKSLWWKPHLTRLQIIQHCIIFISMAMPLFNPSCSYPKLLLAILLPANILMIYLFMDFYIKTYVKKKPSKEK